MTDINTVATIIKEDQHLTIRPLAEALHFPQDTKSEDNKSAMDDK